MRESKLCVTAAKAFRPVTPILLFRCYVSSFRFSLKFDADPCTSDACFLPFYLRISKLRTDFIGDYTANWNLSLISIIDTAILNWKIFEVKLNTVLKYVFSFFSSIIKFYNRKEWILRAEKIWGILCRLDRF